MTRYLEHRVEHLWAADIARPELLFDHAPTLGVPIPRAALRVGSAGAAGQADQDEHSADPEVQTRRASNQAMTFELRIML